MKEKKKRHSSEKLLDALKDSDRNIRKTAANALGLIGDESAIDNLLNALRDPDRKVRIASAEALGLIGNKRAAGPLIDILKERERRDGSVLKRIPALINIRSGFRSAAIKALIQIDPSLADKNEDCLMWYPDLFCMTCYRRAVKIEISEYIFVKKSFVVCPECYVSKHLWTGITQVTGVIGGNLKDPQIEGTNLRVSLWNETEKTARYADIDSLLIVEDNINYLQAINAVIICLSVLMVAARVKKIPVYTEGNPNLSGGAVRMLMDSFQMEVD